MNARRGHVRNLCPPSARTLGCLAALAFIAVVSEARALDVGLELRDCPNLSEQRVRELMELELSTQVVPARAPERLAALVSVTCAGNEVLIRVTDATTEKLVSRTFTLAESEPDVRARAVALAAAELVVTSWAELMLAKPPQQAAPPAPWVNDNRRAARAVVQRRVERGVYVDALLALGAAGGTFDARLGAWGGGLRLSLACPEPRLGVDGDVSATLENEPTSLGSVRTNTWSLSLRPALRLDRGRWLANAGLGVRIGLARVEGSAADPNTSRGHVTAGTWGGPLVHVNLGLRLDHFVSRLGAEAGLALRGLSGTVDGREQSGVRGPWVLITLGVGWGA